MAKFEDIVSTEWLNENLLNPKVRVLDVTWFSDKNGQEIYAKEHIPGAVYFDLFRDAQNSEVLPRNVMESSVFQQNARAAGVNTDSHVVVYDSEGKGGFFIGSRAWWTFKHFGHRKVSVLNGGLQKWKNDGFAVSSEIPKISEGNFVAKLDKDLKRPVEFMKQNLGEKSVQVLDSRPTNVYSGNKDDKKTGHYPGAINIPFAANLLDSEKGTFKTKEELQKVFARNGVDVTRPIVTMCNSGMSSCSLLLAAKVAGSEDSSVFQGGFIEWRNSVDESKIEQS